MSSDMLLIMLISINNQMVPAVTASVTLRRDFTAVLSVDGNIIPAAHLCGGTRPGLPRVTHHLCRLI